MIDCVSSVVLVGVQPRPRLVDVCVGSGGPSFHLVGLPDAAFREAKGRVRAAIRRSGFTFPSRRVMANSEESSLILKRHVMDAIAYRGQR